MKRAAEDDGSRATTATPVPKAKRGRQVVVLSAADKNEDVSAVRRSVGIKRNAVRGSGFALSISKGGFDSVIGALIGDAFRLAEAQRKGQWRYTAIVGDTVENVERPQAGGDTMYCTVCFDAPLGAAVVVPCGHRFCCPACAAEHAETLLAAGKPCPVCNQAIERVGGAGDVVEVFATGVEGAPIGASVTFTVNADKTRTFVDHVALVRDDVDLREALKAYIRCQNGTQGGGGGGAKDDDKDTTWAPILLFDLATHSPSLFWSLYALATERGGTSASDGDGASTGGAVRDVEAEDVDNNATTEEKMDRLQCRLLGVQHQKRAGGRSTRARR